MNNYFLEESVVVPWNSFSLVMTVTVNNKHINMLTAMPYQTEIVPRYYKIYIYSTGMILNSFTSKIFVTI